MSGLLRKLAIGICKPIYKLIPDIYTMFFKFANGQFFTDDTIAKLSQNIYILVSVVMLFAFSVTILSAIVNPDLLTDNKKGVAAVFKRAIIGLLLIVLIPIAFNEAYSIQKQVMEKGLIEKIIVGVSYSDENSGGNGGQVIAGTLIGSILYPAEDNLSVEATDSVGQNYKKMVVDDINYIDRVAEDINVTADGKDEGVWASKSTKYAFEFNGLVALIAGAGCCYILLLFSIDTAIRMVKLGFLELTAPISVVSYIAVGDDIFKRWIKEVGKTYADVFMRIVCISFYIFLIANLDNFMDRIQGGLITKVVLIVGLLIFVKQIPEFINSIFGTNIQYKGGIGGRLGQMAGVGEIAKKAWGGIKNVAALGAGAAAIGATGLAGLGIAGAAGGLGYLGHRAWNKGLKPGKTPLKETGVGRFLRTTGKATGSFLKGSNVFTGFRDAGKAIAESEGGKQFITESEMKRKNKIADQFNKDIGYDSDIGRFVNPIASRGKIKDSLKSNRNINAKQIDVTDKRMKLEDDKATIDLLKEKRNNIISSIEALMSNPANANNKALLQTLGNLKSKFLAQQLTGEEFVNQVRIARTQGLDSGDGYGLVKGIDEINNVLSKEKNEDLKKILIDPESGKMKIKGALDDESVAIENKVAAAKADYEKEKESSSAYAQEIMENYISKSALISAAELKIITKPKYDTAGNLKEENGGPSNYQTESIFSTSAGSTSSQSSNPGSTSSGSASQQGSTASGSTSQAGTSTNEAYSDRMFTVGGGSGGQTVVNNYNSGGNNDTSSQSNSETNNSSAVNYGGGSSGGGSTATPDLSPYFDNLSQTIKDTNKDTNDILNKQLQKQDEISKATSTGFNNINSTLNDGFNRVHTDMNKVNNSLKDVGSSMDNLDSRMNTHLNNSDEDDE